METLRNAENENAFGARAKGFGLRNNNAARKPLRGLNNLPVKASFREKPQIKAKENPKELKPTRSFKTRSDVKKEALQNVSELQNSLPIIESHSTKQLPPDVENIDSEDFENPQLVSVYINDIYFYLRHLEVAIPIKKHHMNIQPEITGKMRGVLIDWLVQVHLNFHLLQETLFMTVSILDRYIQTEKVKRSNFQLVGVTAMFIASKYEEMYAPDISDFVYVSDNTYSKQEILQMERKMLKTLKFDLSKPLPLHFLRRNSKAGNVDATVHTLAKYLMELTLPEYDCAFIRPSVLAAASLYLARKLLMETSWTTTLEFYSQYTEEELMPVVKQLCKILLKVESSSLSAIRTKYGRSKLFQISTIPQLKSATVMELAGAKS